jgi:hypothetical protein
VFPSCPKRQFGTNHKSVATLHAAMANLQQNVSSYSVTAAAVSLADMVGIFAMKSGIQAVVERQAEVAGAARAQLELLTAHRAELEQQLAASKASNAAREAEILHDMGMLAENVKKVKGGLHAYVS